MEAALSIIATLAGYIPDALKPALQSGGLSSVLQSCLASGVSVDVSMGAFRTVAGFVSSLEEPKERDAFQPLLPAMLGVLGRALQSHDEASAQV